MPSSTLPSFDSNRLRKIMLLAAPIMLGMVSQNLLNLVDTAFVGRLGDSSLAAVGMGGFANWLLVSALLGLGAGVQATAARRLGEGSADRTAEGLNAALVLAVTLGVPAAVAGVRWAEPIFTLLNDDPEVVALGTGYLAARFVATPFAAANVAFRGFWNGTNRPVLYLFTLVLMHSVNIVLDYVLIFGKLGFPQLGVEGAGWATSISVTLGSAVYLVLGWSQARRNGFLRVAGLAKVIPLVVRLSVPAGLQQFFFSAGFVIFFIIAGLVGTATLAASTVLINLALVCVLPGVGLGLAGASFVGQAMGRGDLRDARRWGWEVACLGALCMGLLGLGLALGSRFWLGIFIIDSPDTLELAVVPLVILGLAQALDGVGVVLLNVLVGIGDTLAAFLLNLGSQWGVFLPLAYIFSVELGYGMIALWIGMVGYRGLTAILMVWRFRSGAWTQAEA